MSGNHPHGSTLSEMDVRVRALETLLIDKGYVDPAALDALIETYETRIGPHNGARVVAALHEEGCAMPPVAAIGESTARVIGHAVDLVSRRANAASLVEEFPTGEGRVVVVQGARADTTLVEGLTAKGWRVTRCDVYETVDTEPSADDLARAASADAIVFASGSAAENWSRLVGAGFAGVVVVIGPVTKTAAESVGLRVDAMAAEPSVEGLVSVLASTLSP